MCQHGELNMMYSSNTQIQYIFERLGSEHYISCCLNFIVFLHSYIRRYTINTSMDFNNDAIMPSTKNRYPNTNIHITMEIIETALHRVSKTISLWVSLFGFYARKWIRSVVLRLDYQVSKITYMVGTFPQYHA